MIAFTQYLRPHGRTRIVRVGRPPEIEAMAQDLIRKGYVFEIEELQTGQVSMSIEDHSKEDVDVLAMEICPNGPAVPESVDKMIREAHARLKKK